MEKSNNSEPRDRLSELPDSLILLILSFLPLRNAVRTTILSKRWKDLWTNIPYLNFIYLGKNFVRFRNYANFVNRTLILRKGTKILKFNMLFCNLEGPASSDLDLWLRYAIENEVEELCVDLLGDWKAKRFSLENLSLENEYWTPQRLYSCLSIKKLSLVGCQLKIHGKVRWDQLKCLTITGVPLSEHVINQVLSGSPQLEVLILRPTGSHENLSIRSSSLKMLTIENYVPEAKDAVLTIWAPNVKTLEISGVVYRECVLMNLSSLSDATVAFDYGPFSGHKLPEGILGQFYRTNRRVEKVTSSYWSIKALVEMKKKHVLAPFSNAKFLKLYADEVDGIVGLLEVFPKLTMLVLEEMWTYREIGIFEIHCDIREPFVTKSDTETLESKTDVSKSCLLHLTTVEIAWIDCNEILSIIEFLLKHAGKLEKLVLRVAGSMSLQPESMLLIADKLLRMPRSSPTAEVILCKK